MKIWKNSSENWNLLKNNVLKKTYKWPTGTQPQ